MNVGEGLGPCTYIYITIYKEDMRMKNWRNWHTVRRIWRLEAEQQIQELDEVAAT